jgi:hypothetical protein
MGQWQRDTDVATARMQLGALLTEFAAKTFQDGIGQSGWARGVSWACPELHPADVHQVGVAGSVDVSQFMEPFQNLHESAGGDAQEVRSESVHSCASPTFNCGQNRGLAVR